MAFSQQILTDLKQVRTNVTAAGPSSVTTANSIAPAGPIMDYVGMVSNVVLKVEELRTNLQLLLLNTDSSTDAANLALLQGVLNDLV